MTFLIVAPDSESHAPRYSIKSSRTRIDILPEKKAFTRGGQKCRRQWLAWSQAFKFQPYLRLSNWWAPAQPPYCFWGVFSLLSICPLLWTSFVVQNGQYVLLANSSIPTKIITCHSFSVFVNGAHETATAIFLYGTYFGRAQQRCKHISSLTWRRISSTIFLRYLNRQCLAKRNVVLIQWKTIFRRIHQGGSRIRANLTLRWQWNA